jgi:hypothetical protein
MGEIRGPHVKQNKPDTEQQILQVLKAEEGRGRETGGDGDRAGQERALGEWI